MLTALVALACTPPTSASQIPGITGVCPALLFVFFERRSHCAFQADLKLEPFQPLAPNCWYYRHLPPYLVLNTILELNLVFMGLIVAYSLMHTR
jgi:hypothetical protein